MSYPVRDLIHQARPEPARRAPVPVMRRRGIIASLLGTVLTVLSARRQLARITRHYRASPPQDLPDYLRADIGLPPVQPRNSRAPWEVLARWK